MNIKDKTRLLQTSVLSSLIIGMSGVAFAQTVEQTPEVDEEFAEEDNIVVTGSRIVRPDLDTVFPTTSVTTEDIDNAAYTNIADALTEIPAFGGGVDPLGDQGSNIGSNFVDFLDLGTQRTLTLVNGRRFVGGDAALNGLSVDFNVIPLALVERIETIGVGGAPVYGSDAIAGTINVILKDDYEGLEGSALFGQTERGDATRRQFQIVSGANTEDGRGNVTFSAEYFKQEGLRQTDRPEIYTDEPFLSEVSPGTPGFTDIDADGDGTPDSVFRVFNRNGGNGSNVQLFTNGGVISPSATFIPSFGLGSFGGDFFQFAPNGDLVNFEAGQSIPGTSAFFAQGGNTFDFFDQAGQVQSPLERINFGSTMRYEITNNVRFKADVQFANTKSEELTNQGGFQTFVFGGLSSSVVIPVSNPFLNDQARGTLASLGLNDGDSFNLSRFNNDLVQGGRRESESFVWRFAGGLEGDFEAAGRQFRWDAYAVAGQSSNETSSQPTINDLRFLNSIEAVSVTDAERANILAGGGIVTDDNISCGVTRDYFNGVDRTTIRGVVSGSGLIDDDPVDVTSCVPLNLFGEGAASPEALEYLIQRAIQTSDIEQRIFSANLSGELLQLPAGWLQFNVGYESRRESGLFAVDGATEVGLGRSAAQLDTGGGFSTDEFLGELLLPIISPDMDIPLVYNLEAEGQIREISNSAAGDATVWTVGGSYQPIQELTFRGNKTRSVRAPSLGELFAPVGTTFEFADDPCDMRFVGDGDNAANRAANCASIGIAQPFTSNVVNATARGLSGGNPNLLNETADGFTIGAVFQPSWFADGLTVTADYINIEIEDLIGPRSLEQNLEACFDADPADFPQPVCDSFERDAGGQVVSFVSGETNADAAEFQFLNLKADYTFEVADLFARFGSSSGDLGELSLSTNAFHVIERATIVDGVTLDNTIGGFGDPRWSGTIDAVYNRGGLRLFWRTFWQDRNLFSPSGNNLFANSNDEIIESVGGRFIHNASISYDISQLTENYDKPIVLQFNVDNVFDRTPGRGLRRSFGNFGTSEVFGRRFTARVRATF